MSIFRATPVGAEEELAVSLAVVELLPAPPEVEEDEESKPPPPQAARVKLPTVATVSAANRRWESSIFGVPFT